MVLLGTLLHAPSVLKNQKYEALYKDFVYFNVLQTIVFTSLYVSDDNILIAAPIGSGRTTCVEFAILKDHLNASILRDHMLVVCITPSDSLAKWRCRDWGRKFWIGLQIHVNVLTGILSIDSEIIGRGGIVITTAYNWDRLSRTTKPRVTLLIIDELHLIGSRGGAVLEAVVCRMKYEATQSGNKIRIVALSTSLANQSDLDLGVWIGVKSHGIFNFSHDLLEVPRERHIQGVDISDFEARMHAMVKITCTAVEQHCKKGKSALVYVPSRKYVRLTAVDLMTYAYGAEKSSFCLCPDDVKKRKLFIEKVSDETLKDTLGSGVGYLHEGLSILDQDVVCTLFEAGLIQVCVMTSSMCWEVPLLAYLVVVMGTQYYDGQENVHTDYPGTDLLQMMGRACRPPIHTTFLIHAAFLVRDNPKCVILCHAPREKYYQKEFPYAALPVESCLDRDLLDLIIAEVGREQITSVISCMDYFKSTFLYTRLKRSVSENDLMSHFNMLVQNTFDDLSSYGMCEEDDSRIKILHLGKFAFIFYVKCTSIMRFNLCFTSQMLKDFFEDKNIETIQEFVEILTDASEYSHLPIRRGDEEVVQQLFSYQRLSFDNPRYRDPHVKANALLCAHFSRHPLCVDLASDQREIILIASRLLPAMHYVFCGRGLLKHALSAVKISQMVTQGMWDSDSVLLQLPHFSKELAKRCEDNPGKSVATIYDLDVLPDDERRELLQMSDVELLDISEFMNQYPRVELKHEILSSEYRMDRDDIRITMQVIIQRHGRTKVGPVNALRYPMAKQEVWWLVVGDPDTELLKAVKKVLPQGMTEEKLHFASPAGPVKKNFRLYLICDSYLGCDQEYDFTIDIPDEDSWGSFQSADA